MKVNCVVDVGNSSIKWGMVRDGAVRDVSCLDLTNQQNWLQNFEEWKRLARGDPLSWAVAGSNAEVRDQHVHFLSRLSERQVCVLKDYRQLPLQLNVHFPERVGLDRLLDAVAVNSRRAEGQPAVIVDAGSAVTVDLVDEAGVFQGGAIFPGLRLMGRALHVGTAVLPEIRVQKPSDPPGKFTEEAIATGIFHAAAGGIMSLVKCFQSQRKGPLPVFLGGGDGRLFQPYLADRDVVLWPEMTLEGIRLSAEHV
ncbi:MAG: type III pantothenate kinase [Planctomycetes bacterium]|nr:type III pantothenate kinase [Planctomycetota bacterium]